SGNIWCGTNGSGVFCFDGQGFSHIGSAEDIGQAVVSSILEDRHGNMWFGTYGAGAFRYDGKVLTQLTQEEGLSDDYILCLLEDR
ncbi:UNVERIFIED_CONTAM: histidine kinase, partial [Salmonella enterica subsp. enterica serovar Weltevreden]